MRIAQVSPLFEAVPPRYYGGTERIVYNLTEALVELGHKVTLFASGDSLTSADLRSCAPQALRLAKCKETITPHTAMFERLRKEASQYDIIHYHTEYLHFGASRAIDVPSVSTLHGRLDLPEFANLFHEFRDLALVSISDYQRRPIPDSNWVGTVPHGLLGRELHFHPEKGAYLAFIGRFSREKRVDRAIEIARRTGWKLKIAAKVEPEHDGEYLEEIEDLLREPHVEFVGEIGEHQKSEFLGGAAALLFPIDWPEPFGLVMIESLAVGTPVIAFKNGSVPEVLRDQETGFVVTDLEQACQAVEKIDSISRLKCRKEFETRFSARQMAQNYLALYERLIGEHRSSRRVNCVTDSRPTSYGGASSESFACLSSRSSY